MRSFASEAARAWYVPKQSNTECCVTRRKLFENGHVRGVLQYEQWSLPFGGKRLGRSVLKPSLHVLCSRFCLFGVFHLLVLVETLIWVNNLVAKLTSIQHYCSATPW